jgi:malonate decarboxylase delta subunit
MSSHAGIETLDYQFHGFRPAGAFPPVLVGVVGSGNL